MVRDKPLCMYATKFLFNTCRVPRREEDTVVLGHMESNQFITVLSKGHIFALRIASGGKYVSEAFLQRYANVSPPGLHTNLLMALKSACLGTRTPIFYASFYRDSIQTQHHVCLAIAVLGRFQ